MDKIAVISDIHGNLTALEAVVRNIRQRRIKRILCLGDLVGKGPQPAEVVDRIRELCEVTVQGNWDLGINRPQDKPAGQWQAERLGQERLDYLRTLPFSCELELSGKYIRLFHASAVSVDYRVLRKADKKEKRAMFELTDRIEAMYPERTPDVVIYGDIHIPFMQMLNAKPRTGLTLWNVGSVGLPYDGIAEACYGIIEGKTGPDPAPFGLQLVRVPYDIGQAIRVAEEAELPQLERYRTELETGLEFE
ncbi:metallophosphoesterase family protein [Paenibacillus hamazuiensis]|uniref:metallophosphoesterase family protein n=1 Tax=Paenibacillus hamazuiensis TaxID=2936508 RepID=UPI00200F4CB7|nr:metallophosphoesterase family protein [Paenibacillus hamazuiensis]